MCTEGKALQVRDRLVERRDLSVSGRAKHWNICSGRDTLSCRTIDKGNDLTFARC